MSKTAHEDDVPLSAMSEPTIPDAFMRDTTPDLDVATFDLEAFVSGVRPTRRTVKLHERADLIGVMDEIANRIDSMPDDADVDDLIAAFDQAKQDFHANTTYWTVEKRSSEWITGRWAAYAKAHNIRLDNGDTDNRQDRLALVIDQMVGQIVEVKTDDGRRIDGDVTHARLRALYDSNESELNKIAVAMNDANTSMAQSAKVLTRDFSPRSSTARNGEAS